MLVGHHVYDHGDADDVDHDDDNDNIDHDGRREEANDNNIFHHHHQDIPTTLAQLAGGSSEEFSDGFDLMPHLLHGHTWPRFDDDALIYLVYLLPGKRLSS